MPIPPQVPGQAAVRRRTTAAALKQATSAFLAEALPPGWTSQPLAAPTRDLPAADLLVISPRGRCHFLFVRAPADRWWDGGPRSVPVEKLSGSEHALARQLRAAGHKTRAVWGARDLARALKAWGCPLTRPVTLAGEIQPAPARRAAKRAPRPKLQLRAWRRPIEAGGADA